MTDCKSQAAAKTLHTGTCHCTKTQYQISGMPLTCYVCHCRDCQRSSGSAFSTNLIVFRKDLSLLSGETSTHSYHNNNRTLQQHQCTHCGTTLWFASTSTSEYLSLQTGTLDNPRWCQPVAHLWMQSAVEWMSLDNRAVQFQTQPAMDELTTLWKHRNNVENGL